MTRGVYLLRGEAGGRLKYMPVGMDVDAMLMHTWMRTGTR